MKNKFKLSLQTKIALLSIALVLISLIITIASMLNSQLSTIQKYMQTNLTGISESISNSPVVIDTLKKGMYNPDLQKYLDKLMQDIDSVDIIVVADINGVRLSHPDKNEIGKKFVGGDEAKVVREGKKYISEARGSLGMQMRAFAPVVDEKGTRLGFVMISTYTERIKIVKRNAFVTGLLISLIGLTLGIVGSVYLSRNIKYTLLGYEPEQITKMYLEKQEVLDAMEEGIIAIDDKGKITLFNNAAMTIFKIKDKKIIGENIRDILPTTKLPIVMEKKQVEYNKDMRINDTIILVTRIPIINAGIVIGAIAIFRNKTEVTRLAEELTGVKQIVHALRANTHEFMNKLHVILGLMQIGEIEEAKKYILDITEEHRQEVSMVMRQIEEPTIAALILGKMSRAKEAEIRLTLDPLSSLKKNSKWISRNSLITIIGNLIENSIEAINLKDDAERNISVFIFDNDKSITIEVEDTGLGINEENLQHLYIRGFSTKGENRGTGLFLIKEILDNLNGDIEVETELSKGTIFTIVIPKEENID